MKIIKKCNRKLARRKIKQTKRFECETCGCIFEADKGEYLVRDYLCDAMCYAECPCCGSCADEAKMESD